MVGGNAPQHGSDGPFEPFELPALAGSFGYRFNGYTMAQDRPFYLLGIGHLSIDREGKITGDHQSSITAIEGEDATVMSGEYTLWGRMTITSNGVGQADIFFTRKDGQGKNVLGEFFVQVAGTVDRFWMISRKALTFDLGQGQFGNEAVELASLEAVRMALPSSS
jgi:hypothetical protein